MSRIHEALKKAAQERSAQVSNDGNVDYLVEDVLDRGDARSDVREPGTIAPPQRKPGAGAQKDNVDDPAKKCRQEVWRPDPRLTVFSSDVHGHVGAERFRTLRSRLFQIASSQPLKRILVTSSVPAEGKTFVAANLAQSIVRQPDRRVLLVDADLRASRLHEILGAPSGPGLSDYLSGDKEDVFSVIQKSSDSNLFFIPGGKHMANPSELLLHDRMKQLLDKLSPVFDFIVIDSPPSLPVHDASILADMSDGVLFVVRAGKTDFELAAKASAEFHEKNLLGVVLNCVEKGSSAGEYYYGYGDDRGKPANEKN